MSLRSTTQREIAERCDSAFLRSLLTRSNSEETLRKIDSYATFIAAYVKGSAVGYAAIYINDEVTRTAYISMLGVVKEMQERRIGSALLRDCIDRATTNGMTRIRLEVNKLDAVAIVFYQHWGFEYEKDCSEESIFMVKDLL